MSLLPACSPVHGIPVLELEPTRPVWQLGAMQVANA
jgi:hypothetical protein